MLGLACFVAVGAVFGFVLRLPGFAICLLAILVIYAAFSNGFSGMGRVYDLMFATFSLQLGYFLALLVRSARYLQPRT
jgi:hypothetical protein